MNVLTNTMLALTITAISPNFTTLTTVSNSPVVQNYCGNIWGAEFGEKKGKKSNAFAANSIDLTYIGIDINVKEFSEVNDILQDDFIMKPIFESAKVKINIMSIEDHKPKFHFS